MNWYSKMRMADETAEAAASVMMDLAEYVDKELDEYAETLLLGAWRMLTERGTTDSRWVPDYAEPGWRLGDDSHGVFMVYYGDHAMPRLADLMETAGFEVVDAEYFHDCTECYRAVSVRPDSYGWQKRFFVGDGWLACDECLRDMGYTYDEDAGDYVEPPDDYGF